ncbi:MAG: hypothetical protein ACFFBC_06215 [Promethearchaeota archaeon]
MKIIISISSKKEKQSRLRKVFLYGKSFIPFFFSHHPECEYFKGHTLKCGKIKLCIGCFIGYPTAFFALLLIRLLDKDNFFNSDLFFILSMIFLGTFFLSPLKLTKNKMIKIIQKFLIGFGAALLFNWIMERPYSKKTNLRIASITFYIILIILNIYHAYSILGSCYKCETPFNWGMCSGFCTIRDRMKENELNNFLIKTENFSHRILERRVNRKN